jgi:hypothetical protein
MVMTILKTSVFLINMLGRRFICSKCPLMELRLNLIWFAKHNRVMIYKMHGSCSITLSVFKDGGPWLVMFMTRSIIRS